MRYMTGVAGGGLLSLVATLALAHAHLKNAVPADGGVVSAPPANVVLTFSENARLTAAWIQKDGGPREKIATLPTNPAERIAVPMSKMEPGAYTLSWRVVGGDGHVMPGQIQFTVSGGAAAAREPVPSTPQPTHSEQH